MLPGYAFLLVMFFCQAAIMPLNVSAQKKNTPGVSNGSAYTQDSLFDDDDILHLTLTGKLQDLFNDRGSDMVYHPLLLQYLLPDSSVVSIQLTAKTRGHFRRDKMNCRMPPLLLNFPKEKSVQNTVFKSQNKLKLVVPCRGDNYVINEWLVYRLYNLISDKSFKARLVLVDFEDSLQRRKTETHYCILLEDEKRMAGRNQSFLQKEKIPDMKNLARAEFKKMAVFQYMIGNTDWGVPYLQNIVLIKKDSVQAPVAVPYDFDHAGIVDASYAGPAPELEIASNLVRLYRGFCETDMKNFTETFELFNHLKDDIYKVYTDCPLLNSHYINFATRYLDDFYKTINSPKAVQSEFGKPCRTGIRVEIKPLEK